MKKLLLLTLVVSITSTIQGSPLWLRYSTISPDGTQIAFKYKGDIYTVPTDGGLARQLTSTEAHESYPIWSFDSQTIAFASDKEGGFDIYTISKDGGQAKRITTHSAAETPLTFSPDSKEIYFSAAIQDPASSALNPASWISELYRVDANGGSAQLVVAAPISNISFDQDGESFLYYNRSGSENIWRKHHTSSVARDIFHYNAKTQIHTPIIERAGEDRDPLYSSDKKSFYFLSERNGGSFNIYKALIDSPDQATALTSFTDHPVRFLSISKSGVLAFSYHGELYTLVDGGKPKKVSVEILNDKPEEQFESLKLSSGNGFSVSEDGKNIAFVSRGEVFATTDKYSTTKQITKTPQAEKGVTISPDGKSIVYASERTGTWALYLATMVRESEINFANSTLINEEPLFKASSTERTSPKFSPDGTEIAFIENRDQLKVLNLESKKVRTITSGTTNYDTSDTSFRFEWSPDGKWFVMESITNRRYPYCDIAIVSAEGGGKLHTITQSAYIDSSPKWAMDGNAIIYISNRYGMRSQASWGSQNDVFIAFVNQESYDKFKMSKEELELYEAAKKEEDKAEEESKEKDDKKSKSKEVKPINIELDRLEDRVIRLTPTSSNLRNFELSKDGEKLYFISRFEKGPDLWEVSTRTKEVKLLKKLSSDGALQLSADGKSIYCLGSNPTVIELPGGSTKSLSFSINMDLDKYGEREYMFDHVFTQQLKRFYNVNYHGVNLPKLKKEYAPFLPHINNNYDFAEMLSEILGELNVSHTGSGYRAKFTGKTTPAFGLLFDQSYTKDGLKIDEVLRFGPFDNSFTKVKQGAIIEKIDGIEIKANADYYPIINGKTGENMLLSLYDPSTKERWEEVFKPISIAKQNSLLYKRWVRTRAEEVDRLSNGRLGYVHITSMDDESYRNIYSDVLGRFYEKEGVVIDTRNNGGGRLHEDIEILFSGEKYLEQVIRDSIACDMPSRRYNKPSIMIVCEANYSNAHGTPWVYQNRGIGSIVGMPVPGTMTTVSWETLQDNSLYFGIPIVGYRTKEGEYLENLQLEPEFKVRNQYDKVISGVDQQLEFAVEQLLREIEQDSQDW